MRVLDRDGPPHARHPGQRRVETVRDIGVDTRGAGRHVLQRIGGQHRAADAGLVHDQRRPAVRVHGHDASGTRYDGQVGAAVLVPGDREAQHLAGAQAAEVLGERHLQHVVLDRLGDAVRQLQLHAEEPVEVVEPRAPGDRVLAGAERQIHGGALGGPAGQLPAGAGGELPGGREEVERRLARQSVGLAGEGHRQVGGARRHVTLVQGREDQRPVGGAAVGVAAFEEGGHDQGRAGVRADAAGEVHRLQHLGEGRQFPQRSLGRPGGVGDAEVHLEGVVVVGGPVPQVVVVGVVPGEPARGPAQQRVVQGLPVEDARVGGRDGVGRQPELLQHDGLPGHRGQLALERGTVVLARPVGVGAVHVRADEVDVLGRLPQREAVVAAGDLDAPRPVAQRHRLRRARRPHRVAHGLRPRGHHVGGRRVHLVDPAVPGHLVGDQPARDRRVVLEAAGHAGDEPGLAADHPHVLVQVPVAAPGGVPVLARHVADDEGRYGPHAGLRVGVEEVLEPRAQFLVDPVRLRVEVRPVEEGTGRVQAVLGEHTQFVTDDGRVVVPPHQRAAGAGPEVGAEPGQDVGLVGELGAVASHGPSRVVGVRRVRGRGPPRPGGGQVGAGPVDSRTTRRGRAARAVSSTSSPHRARSMRAAAAPTRCTCWSTVVSRGWSQEPSGRLS